jgi:hypothetical protein
VRIHIVMCCLLAMCLNSQAQVPRSNADAAEKIWEQVCKLGVGHDISVKTVSGASYHGQISRIDDNEFEIREVDLRTSIRWYYSEVKSVRGDYSSKNILGKRHNPRYDQIITAGGLGGIMLLILLAVPKT